MTDTTPDDYVELTTADLTHRWRERTVPEYVDEAIAANPPGEEYATAEAALRWHLQLAWHDLNEACRRAANGRWSMECDSHVGRIAGLTRLVGPISWRGVQAGLLVSGVFEQVHAALGTPTPLDDDAKHWARGRVAR